MSVVCIPKRAFLDARLKKSDLGVLASLNNRTDKKGYCYPSYKTIGLDTNMTRRTAITSVKRLIECGYLVKESRFIDEKEEQQTSNRYYINYNPA